MSRLEPANTFWKVGRSSGERATLTPSLRLRSVRLLFIALILPFRKDGTVTAEKLPENLRDKSSDFADFYLSLGNPGEAAVKVGCPPDSALAEGLRMLGSSKVRSIIRKRRRDGLCRAEALAGLRRLAFGRINDALVLLSEDGCGDFSRLDLFNVSEIKRVKGGGMEVRFFDRLEALRTLAELEEKEADGEAADNFFSALNSRGAEDGC